MASKNNMTFTASMRLRTAEFKKGVAEIQRSLGALKNSFLAVAGALGAGLGLTRLLGNLKDTAIQLSVAKNVLENVSKSVVTFNDGVKESTVVVDDYARNLAFVDKLAKDYHQDLAALINNFAQFHAACQNTNLSLEDQKYIFDALTKSAAYFHMSADRTKDMMNAVVQMVSKGKVAAEELRRQLGNALPGAFNLMADSMGVTTQQLDDMMRKGQVIADEVLPKFAAKLFEITEGANFDSLQLHLNDLKNTWYAFVEGVGAEGMYDSLIQGTNSFLSFVTKNVNAIKTLVKSTVLGILSYKLFDKLQKRGEEFFAAQSAELEKSLVQYNKYFKEIEKLSNTRGNKTTLRQTDTGTFYSGKNSSVAESVYKANAELIKIEQLKRKIGSTDIMSNKDLEALKKYNRDLAKAHGLLVASKKEMSMMQKIGLGLQGIVKSITTALKSMGIAAIIGLVVTAVTALVDMLKQAAEKANEIAQISSNYEKTIADANRKTAVETSLLKEQLEVVKDRNREEKERIGALNAINEKLGLMGSKKLELGDLDRMDTIEKQYDRITAAVLRWCRASELQGEIEANAAYRGQAVLQREENNAKIAELKARQASIEAMQTPMWSNNTGTAAAGFEASRAGMLLGIKGDIATLEAANRELDKTISRAHGRIVQLQGELAANASSGGGGGGGKSSLTDILKKYQEEVKKLDSQLKEGAISAEEYQESLNKLIFDTFRNAAATGEVSMEKILEKVAKNKHLTNNEKLYKELFEKYSELDLSKYVKGGVTGIDKLFKEYTEEKEKLDNKLKEGAMSENDWKKEYEDLIVKYFTAAAETGDLGMTELIEKVNKNEALTALEQWYYDLGTAAGPILQRILAETQQQALEKSLYDAYKALKYEPETRDTTFDYKKTSGEKLDERLGLTEKTIAKLEDFKMKYEKLLNDPEVKQEMKDQISEMITMLGEMKDNVPDLKLLTRIVEVREDMEQMLKDMDKMAYTTVKDLASSMDRVVKGMESLKKVMEDTDSTAWEKFTALFNQAVQVIDAVYGVIQSLAEMQKLSNTLTAAGASLIELENKALERKAALLALITELEGKEIDAKTKAIAMSILEKSASDASASSNAKDAVASVAKEGGKLPFPYNLVAWGAGIAALMGILSIMSQFAAGGYVGGNSYKGDKQLARVNSGELILNATQQRNLLNLANGKGGANGGQVNFTIKGADLVGVLNNYGRLRK